MKKLTQKEFLGKAKRVHGDTYTFKNTVYTKGMEKITVTCKKHGDFNIRASHFLMGHGCQRCAALKTNKKRSIQNVKNKHIGLLQPEDYKLIPLTKNKFAKVDNEDFGKLNMVSWSITNNGYAKNGKLGLLHRFIINAPENFDVDHKNLDKLDCRKENLRLCNKSQNGANISAKKYSSQYKGVSWYSRVGKWASKITCKGIEYRLGYHDNEENAAMVYNEKAKELFGEFARLNVIK